MNHSLEVSLERRSCALVFERGANPVKCGQDGLPDRLVLWGGGRHFWIEFKKEKTGHLRASQRVWKKYLEGSGDLVFVVEVYQQMVDIMLMMEVAWGAPTARRPS